MVILSDLWGCFSPRSSPEVRFQGGKELSSCAFCQPSTDRFDIIAKDDHYLVFKDRSPAALYHLLAIPREHIDNVKSLEGSQGADIVRDLQDIGSKALRKCMTKEEGANELRFGFHIPPFRRCVNSWGRCLRYTLAKVHYSIEHLHLHCLVLPFGSTLKGLKYRIAAGDLTATPPTSKGWGWFVTAKQAIDILEGGGRIKVAPC